MYLKNYTLNFIWCIENFLISTAWLSSVCVVKCNIQLFNKRNPRYKYYLFFLLKKHVGLIEKYIIYDLQQRKTFKIVFMQ